MMWVDMRIESAPNEPLSDHDLPLSADRRAKSIGGIEIILKSKLQVNGLPEKNPNAGAKIRVDVEGNGLKLADFGFRNQVTRP